MCNCLSHDCYYAESASSHDIDGVFASPRRRRSTRRYSGGRHDTQASEKRYRRRASSSALIEAMSVTANVGSISVEIDRERVVVDRTPLIRMKCGVGDIVLRRGHAGATLNAHVEFYNEENMAWEPILEPLRLSVDCDLSQPAPHVRCVCVCVLWRFVFEWCEWSCIVCVECFDRGLCVRHVCMCVCVWGARILFCDVAIACTFSMCFLFVHCKHMRIEGSPMIWLAGVRFTLNGLKVLCGKYSASSMSHVTLTSTISS